MEKQTWNLIRILSVMVGLTISVPIMAWNIHMMMADSYFSLAVTCPIMMLIGSAMSVPLAIPYHRVQHLGRRHEEWKDERIEVGEWENEQSNLTM